MVLLLIYSESYGALRRRCLAEAQLDKKLSDYLTCRLNEANQSNIQQPRGTSKEFVAEDDDKSSGEE